MGKRTVVDFKSSRKLGSHREYLYRFLLRRDLLFFDYEEVSEETSDYLKLNLSSRDYYEIKDCVIKFSIDSSTPRRYTTADPLTDSESNKWKFRISCTDELISLRLATIPHNSDKDFEIFYKIEFDVIEMSMSVSSQMSFPKIVEADGLINRAHAKLNKFQVGQLKAKLEQETQDLAKEIAEKFATDLKIFRKEDLSSGRQVFPGNEVPADLLSMPLITRRMQDKIISLSLFAPSKTNGSFPKVIVRRQILFFDVGKRLAVLGRHELIVYESGHGAIVVCFDDLSLPTRDYHVPCSWGPFASTGGIDMEFEEVDSASFLKTKYRCQYIGTKMKKDNEHGFNDFSIGDSLTLRKEWHYCRGFMNVDLNSYEGSQTAEMWIVFPFDGVDWEIAKLSLGIN
jgi:hypothetical protein